MDAVFGTLRKVFVSTIDLVRDTGELIRVETQEAARTGFGLPRTISAISSFGCFAIAAGGTSSIAFDAFKKVYGSKECDGCAGWETVCCQICKGTGKVQYGSSSLGIPTGIQSIESSSSISSSDEILLPLSCNTLGSLPVKSCPNCDGSGVMKCKVCKGNATKKCLSLANLLDAPYKSYDVYRNSKPVSVAVSALENDPRTAPYWLFTRQELISGKQFTDAEKEKILWSFLYSQQYNIARKKLLERGEGWEELQKSMINFDPATAISDPAIIHNIGKYNLEENIKKEVWSLPVPPRPNDWVVESKTDLKFRNDLERQVYERNQSRLENHLNEQWEEHWRKNQFEIRVKEMEQKKIKEAEQRIKRDRFLTDAEISEEKILETEKPAIEKATAEAVADSSFSDSSAPEKKKDAKKTSALDEKKKKEREEKKRKYARQAAEREAYLKNLKQNKP